MDDREINDNELQSEAANTDQVTDNKEVIESEEESFTTNKDTLDDIKKSVREQEEFRDQIQSALEFQNRIRSSIQPYLNMQKQMRRSLEPWLEARNRMLSSIQHLRNPIQPYLDAQAKMRRHTQPPRFIENYRKAIQPMLDAQANMRKAALSYSDLASRLMGDFRENTKSILSAIDFDRIKEEAKRIEDDTALFKTIMVEIGFPPNDTISIQHISRVVSIYNERGMVYTKRFVERYMTLVLYRNEEIKKLSYPWENSEWLNRRKLIMKSAIEGHINGYYELTVPTILAQIEGILVEGILLLDELHPDEKIGYGKQKNFLSRAILGDKDIFSFDAEIEKIYTTIVLADFERGKEIESDLSRHAILHGEDTNYGTKLNSVKAIVIFDYLFNKLDDLYKDIEKSKHDLRIRGRRRRKKHSTSNRNSPYKPRNRRKNNNQNYRKNDNET